MSCVPGEGIRDSVCFTLGPTHVLCDLVTRVRAYFTRGEVCTIGVTTAIVAVPVLSVLGWFDGDVVRTVVTTNDVVCGDGILGGLVFNLLDFLAWTRLQKSFSSLGGLSPVSFEFLGSSSGGAVYFGACPPGCVGSRAWTLPGSELRVPFGGRRVVIYKGELLRAAQFFHCHGYFR